MALSKSQVDRLGERLRSGDPSDADLRELDEYRMSFAAASQEVVRVLESLGASPSARPAKSTPSIVDKLRRESLRLSQMQDIAGCRVVVADARRQAEFVETARRAFRSCSVIDRVVNPSYGYRAIHLVVVEDCAVEVQVRTTLQHLWAQVSELASDVIDPAIKYGGGPNGWREQLLLASLDILTFEDYEAQIERSLQKFGELSREVETVRGEVEVALAGNPAPGFAEELRLHLERLEGLFEHKRREQELAVQGTVRARQALVASMNEMIQSLMDHGRGTQ